VTIEQITPDYRAWKFCIALWISITGIMHAIFVCKYWSLSYKIKNILTQTQDDKTAHLRHNVMLYSLLLAIVVACVLECLINLNVDPDKPVRDICVTLFMMVPQIVTCVILIVAVEEIKKTQSSKYQVSTRQVQL
jgi:ABC-type spermidine/putrescine transport system permease subunit II